MVTHIDATITPQMLDYLLRNALGVPNDCRLDVIVTGTDDEAEELLIDCIDAIQVKVDTDLKGATKIEKRLNALKDKVAQP